MNRNYILNFNGSMTASPAQTGFNAGTSGRGGFMHTAFVLSGTRAIVFSIFLSGAQVFVACAAAPTNDEVLASAKSKGKLVADDYFSRNILPNSSNFNYFDACSYYGACLYSEAIQDTAYCKTIYTRYKNNRPGSIPTGDVDKNSCGLLPLHLFKLFNDSSLLKLGKAPADVVVQATYSQKKISTGSVYVRTAIDDTYMVGSLMVQTFRATNDTGYLDFCADYMVYYMSKLQQPNGLYWHGARLSEQFWGRGNGWSAAGFTELLQELPKTHPKYEAVLDGYKKQMSGLHDVQNENGMWMQVLDSKAANNWEETSGTAMFLFAMFTGLKNGWLDEATYLEPAKKGWSALAGYLQGSKLKNVAAGFWPSSDKPNVSQYLNANRGQPGDSHGTAAFLWAATAAINLFTPTPVTHGPITLRQSANSIRQLPVSAGAVFDLLGRSMIAQGKDNLPATPVTGLIIRRNGTSGRSCLMVR
jgi:rhamnogalacturonyl hydrolase YesR